MDITVLIVGKDALGPTNLHIENLTPDVDFTNSFILEEEEENIREPIPGTDKVNIIPGRRRITITLWEGKHGVEFNDLKI